VKAQGGETVGALAARSGSAWKASQVAVANSLKETDTLQQGQVIKITIEEPYTGKQAR
jgi:hypothetical protein